MLYLKKLPLYSLFFFMVVFFFIYAYFYIGHVPIFNSPDEMANFVFIEQFASNSILLLPHQFDYGSVSRFIFPRSAYATMGGILPTGFWGIVSLFGLVVKVFGVSSLVLITPLLAVFSAWCFGQITGRVFGARIGFWSVLLYLVHPAVWYASSRGLSPNGSFVFFLVFGVYFLIFSSRSSANVSSFFGLCRKFLGTVFICLALWVRPNEVFWVVFILLVLFVYCWRVIHRRVFLANIGLGIIFALSYFLCNRYFLGGFHSGYTSSSSLVFSSWYSVLFPFGVDPKTILLVCWHYFFVLFWWYTIPAILGIFFVLSKKEKQSRVCRNHLRIYTIIGAGLTLFLCIYYGSYTALSGATPSIGVAFVRYFLPIYIILIPFVLCFWERLINCFSRRLGVVFMVFVCGFYVFFSAQLVYGGPDGLIAVGHNLDHARFVRNDVSMFLPSDAVILTAHEDKFFWPKFQVMQNIFDPDIVSAAKILHKEGFPVYYFGGGPETGVKKKVENEYAAAGFVLILVKKYPPHALYLLSSPNYIYE